MSDNTSAVIAGACVAGFVYLLAPELGLWRYFSACALLAIAIFVMHEDGS